MALRPLRECKKAGCYELTREANGYCQEHHLEGIIILSLISSIGVVSGSVRD